MPVRRNTSVGFGEMEWLEASEYYGKEARIDYKYSGFILGKDCLVYYNYSYIVAVDCDDSHSGICAYATLQERKSNYCQQKLSIMECISATFSPTTECFCMQDNNRSLLRNNTCQTFAEFRSPYQTFFPYEETCWFGLERNSQEEYVWPSTDEQISYTFWSSSTNFSGKYGAIKDSSGWTLEGDIGLPCGICSTTVTPTVSELALEYEEDTQLLSLTVYSPQDLKELSSGYPFMCFTDTNIVNFKDQHPSSFYSIANFESHAVYKYNTTILGGPGYYWCEAFQYPDFEVIRSNSVLVHDRTQDGNEYVVTLSIKYDSSTNPTFISGYHILIEQISLSTNSSKLLRNMRQMKILSINETARVVQVLMHVTAKPSTGYDREEEYEKINTMFHDRVGDVDALVSVDEFLSSHFCYKTSYEGENTTLNWATTDVGYLAVSEELCILETSTVATRRCVGDFINGAKWSEFSGNCANEAYRSVITEDLEDLLNSNSTPDAIITNLTEISKQFENFKPVDVYLVSKILSSISHNAVNITHTTSIVNSISRSNRTVLMNSQTYLNATDNILYHFDNIVANPSHLSNSSYMQVTERYTVLLITKLEAGIRGIAMYNASNTVRTKTIFQNSSLDDIFNDSNFLAAAYVPDELVQQINATSITDPRLIITLFLNDSLFNELEDSDVTDVSSIFSILIPDFEEEFQAPISVIFKPSENRNANTTCGFWRMNSNSVENEVRSSWYADSDAITQENYTSLVFCEFWHTTHFALLVLSDLEYLEGYSDLMDIIEIITDINCSLSILGLAGILFTSLIFKNWRRNTGNKILINFVFSLCLQIVLLYVSTYANAFGENALQCIVIGALLHYSVVSEFCWMFVIAVLQFKRFVQVFGGPPKWVLVKALIVGWLIPLFPVLILLLASPDNYTDNQNGLCYPSGAGLYLGVLLPIVIVILANIVIYIIILSDVFYKKTDSKQCLNSELILQWRLVVLLFFMLGLTWSFALLAYVYEAILFVILFCFTATLQGFVLFLFFIIFNKSTRMLYVSCFKRCCFKF